jgi:serine protease AprX
MPRPQVQSLVERFNPSGAFTGRGVVLAIVDSGFFPHPDLLQPRKRIRAYADVTREVPAERDLLARRASSWHGTMTACCAAGSGYLSGGRYRSLACESDVVLIKAADDDGKIHGKALAAALRFPLRHPDLGIRILSVSVGVDDDDPEARDVERAVLELTEAGIVVIAAAGNAPGAAPSPPGSATEAITVGGMNDHNTIDHRDDVAWPSSFGRNGQGVEKPDLLAPSILVPAPMVPGTLQAREAHALYDLLTVLEEVRLDPPGDEHARASALALLDSVEARIELQKYIAPDYQHVDGTSFAAPVVASVVAQMLEANPRLTPARVRDALVATARPLPGVPKEQQGAGVVDPAQAVAWAEKS